VESDLRALWQQFDAPEAPASDWSTGSSNTKERSTSPGGPQHSFHQSQTVAPAATMTGVQMANSATTSSGRCIPGVFPRARGAAQAGPGTHEEPPD
jgi:hypothetical protein